jgi:hypothetical protein
LARFLNGLNKDIANIVELNHYMKLKDMVHMTTKVERQIKRRGNTYFQTNLTSSSSVWRLNLKREGVIQLKPYMHARAEPPKVKKDAYMDGKGKSKTQPTLDRDIKCFQCLENGHITS